MPRRRHPHNRHRHQQQRASFDKIALFLRLLCALLGLTSGYIAGQFFAQPLQQASSPTVQPGAAVQESLPPAGAPLEERVAATDRMAEDALGGVLAAALDWWEQNRQTAGAVTRAQLHLRTIFSRWTDLDGTGALLAAAALRDCAYSDLAVEAVMSEWGLRAPHPASQSLSMIPGLSAQQRATEALVRAAVYASPAEGFEIARQAVTVPQYRLRGIAGAHWMRRDPHHAPRYLLDEQPGMEGAVTGGLALGQWLMEDPEGWLAWRKAAMQITALPMLRFAEDVVTPARLNRVGAALQKHHDNMEDGQTWLVSAAGPAAQELIMTMIQPGDALEAEMRSWMSGRATLPPAADTGGWLTRWHHVERLRGLLPRLAAVDPRLAIAMTTAMPAEEEPTHFVPLITGPWLLQAPASASTSILSLEFAHPVAAAAAAATLESAIISDPLKALGGIARLPLEKSAADAHRATAFSLLAERQPGGMLDWLAAHPDVIVPAPVLARAVRNLATADPVKTGEWVRTQAPAVQRSSLLGAMFEIQILRDRDAALATLQIQPPGEEKDAMLSALTNADISLSSRDRFFAGNLLPDAFLRATQITADTPRLTALRGILATMKSAGIAPEPFLSHSSLRPSDRAAISN